jgi:hypothetical protein
VLSTNGIDVRSVVQFTVQTAVGLCRGKVQPLKVKGRATSRLVETDRAEEEHDCFDTSWIVKGAM